MTRASRRSLPALPDFIPPCLATLRKNVPDGQDWLHEVKLDGYRLQARLDGSTVRLFTRTGLDWTHRFPEVARELSGFKATGTIFDGEMVVRQTSGITAFAGLVEALKSGDTLPIEYVVFDVLFQDGNDVRELRLDERRAILDHIMRHKPRSSRRVLSLQGLSGDAPDIESAARELGLEGIISKRRDRPYRSGRQQSWVKVRFITSEDFPIIGYLPLKGNDKAVGALVVGERRGGRIFYAGRVGTGYTTKTARELRDALHPRRSKRMIDVPEGVDIAGVVWTSADLIARVHYRERTPNGLLRQAVFMGLREDEPK